MSLYKSIAKNYAANSIGMGIRFLEQIAMVPLFITLWGIDKYADWILITAFSSFFTMVNMGLNTASINEFIIKYQQQEYAICRKLLINTFSYITVVGSICVFLAVIVALTTGFKGLLQVSVFSESETSVVFILLLTWVFISMYNGVYHGIFRATSHTHITTMIENTVKLAELLILFIGIILKIDIVLIILFYITPVCVGIVYKHWYVQRWFNIHFTIKLFDWKLLKSLVKPSVAFMFMPLGYAISNQGMIFVINVLLGPVILVVFTTTRTLVNFLRSLMNLLACSIEPEVSIAYGKKDIGTLSTLYHRSFIITGALALLCIILLAFIGEPIYLAWTQHAVLFDPAFFYGMLLVLLISCLWGITSIIPMATNNHTKFTMAFLISQLVSVSLVYVALSIYPNIAIIPMALLPAEVFLLYYVIKKTNRLISTLKTSV